MPLLWMVERSVSVHFMVRLFIGLWRPLAHFVPPVASGCAGVAECACVGLPDARSGEKVALFVVRTPGANLTAEQVVAHCRANLAGYKMPASVEFVQALPKSSVGKILRRELRPKD